MASDRQRQLQDQAAGVVGDAAHDVQSPRRPAHEDVHILMKQRPRRSRLSCWIHRKVSAALARCDVLSCTHETWPNERSPASHMLASNGFGNMLPCKSAAVAALLVTATLATRHLCAHIRQIKQYKLNMHEGCAKPSSPLDCEVSASISPRSWSRNSAVSGSSETRSAPADAQHTCLLPLLQ